MARRSSLSRRKSERMFTRSAQKVNRRNFSPAVPMRGGIRL